ncbi:hypothetical protein, partial [Psychrobacillus psychrotolerans]|uniref:hypothetical protein n=1 Tax=Psychrobacillus psychrotolerans TaxID=126156 RepID=UPI003C72022E
MEKIDELFELLDSDVRGNINKQAFNDIGNVFLDLYNHSNSDQTELVKWVCNASPGHGKTQGLIAFLKWLTIQDSKTPVLIAIREKNLVHEILNRVNKFTPNSIISVDSENKDIVEEDLFKYQIVLIQHSRLENMALGYGNLYHYTNYSGKKRILIIDEKPNFAHSTIFNIGSKDNVLEWFDDLSVRLEGLNPQKTQWIKSYIITLLAEQLYKNESDVTTRLLVESEMKSERGTLLIHIIKEMKKIDANKGKFESLKRLEHFYQLLTKDKFGRIDDFQNRGFKGRKIIVSEHIDYSKLNMNILVLDGTTLENSRQYGERKSGFTLKRIENRNNYKRLSLNVETINTTKYSRQKDNHTTQNAISKRINDLKEHYPKIFVLPTKEDVEIYKELNAITEIDYKYYDNNAYGNGLHLLNTVGKNILNDKTALYLTSLPKKHADYYKEIAIAIYGNDVNLEMNIETDDGKWFVDDKLEDIYLGELYSEIMQIIHRTALRNINENAVINVFIAYDEDSEDRIKYGGSMIKKSSTLVNNYLKKEVKIS